jgi:hypothetical protein
MRRIVAGVAVVLALLVPLPALSRAAMHGSPGHGHPPTGYHGSGHGHYGWPRTRVFIGGYWNPFWFGGAYPYYAPYSYPYPYAYSYPYYSYPYPYLPPDQSGSDTPPPEMSDQGEPAAAEAPGEASETPPASYGLVQLRDVPDGATVDLDGRFWLTANDLDQRWVALPDGRHTIAARVGKGTPVERRIDVRPGKTQVVRFGPFPRPGE